MNTKKSITIIGKWPLQFSATIPYIHEFERRGVEIHYYISEEIYTQFKKIVQRGMTVYDLDALANSKRLCKFCHKGVLEVFFLLKKIFKLNSNTHIFANNIIKFLMWPLLKNPFPTRKVFNVTPSAGPWLLSARGIEVYTFMGSWDHPAKIKVTGHLSKEVFTWNNDLSNDWQKCQGDLNMDLAYPVPFHYIVNSGKFFARESMKTIMYPFSSSSNSKSIRFKEECKFVHELCAATKQRGYNLFIKPKPNASCGELNEFSEYSNVQICSYHKYSEKNNLFLTNEYNKIRINELQKVDLVINLSTTFVFDAALYQLPIVQLYFLANIEYPFFTNIHKQIHLAHLLKHKDLLFTINDKIPVKYQLKKYFDEKDLLLEKSRAFSRRLRTWIMPSETMDQAVTRVVDKILK